MPDHRRRRAGRAPAARRRADHPRHAHAGGVPALLHSRRPQRAGRRAGAAHPRSRERAPERHGGDQLRRPHAQHHRRARAPADEAAERGEPAQRDLGLAAGRPRARARRRPGRAAGAVRRGPRRRRGLRRAAGGRGRRADADGGGAAEADAARRRRDGLPGRRAHARGIRGRSHPRLRLDAGRPGRAALRRHGRRAHRHDRLLLRRSRARVTDGLLVPADGLRQRLRGHRRDDGVEGGRACRWCRARTSPPSRWWPRPEPACVRSRRPGWRPAGLRPPAARALRGAERSVRRRPRPGRALAAARLARAPHRRGGPRRIGAPSSSPTRTATTPCWPRRR